MELDSISIRPARADRLRDRDEERFVTLAWRVARHREFVNKFLVLLA
jgi:hypothetical protein